MNEPASSPAVRHNPEEHRYETVVDGLVAFAAYERQDDTLVFNHTFVPPELRGRNVAAVVVRAALEDARRQGARVLPACSYVARFIDRNREFADLVAGSG